jgi:hypothetical protein
MEEPKLSEVMSILQVQIRQESKCATSIPKLIAKDGRSE